MFNKLKTPILGVVENMSNLILKGQVEDANGKIVSNGKIKVNNNEYKIEEGVFSMNLEIFQGKGGENESFRLNVPLLSQIPIDSDLALCTDNGTPYVNKHKNTYTKSCYDEIAEKIISKLEK